MNEVNLFNKVSEESKIESLKSKENFGTTLRRVFFSNRLSKISIISIGIFIIFLIFIIIFTCSDPFLKSEQQLQTSSSEHWLGTDDLGRDIWSRFWYSILITFSLAIIISYVNIILACVVSFAIINWSRFSYVFNYIVRFLRILPSLLILIVLSLLFNETYFIIFISFILTGWSISSEKIDKEIRKLNEQQYLWKAQTLGSKNIEGVFSLFVLMLPFLIYEFFKNIPLIILFEAMVGAVGIHNKELLTFGSVLGESLNELIVNGSNILAVTVISLSLVIFLAMFESLVISINKREFYLEKGELK